MSVTSLIGLGFAFGSNCLLPRRMTCFTGTSSLSNSCNIAAIWQLSSSNLCSELSAVDSVTPCIITLVLLFWISSSSTLSSRNWLRSAPSTHSCTSSGMIVFLVAFVHSFSIFSSNSWTVFFSTVSPFSCFHFFHQLVQRGINLAKPRGGFTEYFFLTLMAEPI